MKRILNKLLCMMLVLLIIPLTSYSPRQKVVQVEKVKRDTVVLRQDNITDYDKYSKDTLIDLKPLIKTNKKMDKLIDMMVKDLNDTIKKE